MSGPQFGPSPINDVIELQDKIEQHRKLQAEHVRKHFATVDWTRSIPYETYYTAVIHPFARGDARRICYDKLAEIKKTGTGRQRGEGVRLLKRIQARLLF